MELSVKQEMFCLEYAKSGNARQAYKSAGYKCRSDESVDANASRLLRNDKVQERLAELAEENKNNSIADIQEMQEVLTSIIRQQAEEEVVVCDPVDGARKLKKNASLKEIISAINTLGKMQGAFADNIKLDIRPVVIGGDDGLED